MAIYRRARRLIGRQPVQVGRLRYRIGIFCVAGTLIAIVSMRDVTLLAALFAGLLAGAVLGRFGLQQTKFELTPEGRFYTPHTYIGLFVSALFLARIAFRMSTLYLRGTAPATAVRDPMTAQLTPLTLVIFGVLAGYYLIFYLGVLRKSRALQLPEARAPVS